MQSKDLEPNVITYSAAISACEKAKRQERALDPLAEMQESLEPDVITHNAASRACEKTKQPERTLDLLAEMQSKDLEPDAVACGAAISAS